VGEELCGNFVSNRKVGNIRPAVKVRKKLVGGANFVAINFTKLIFSVPLPDIGNLLMSELKAILVGHDLVSDGRVAWP
jgi:hypothetical protein